MYNKIILNIPHSSNQGIFDVNIGGWKPNPHFINNCVNQWTDWWTDMLFQIDNPKVGSHIFPLSRFVCDVERLENDQMEEVGQGILYTQFDGYIRNELSEENKNKLLRMREEYLDELSHSITDNTMLIDCHSFPSHLSNTEICIGVNDDFSYDENMTKAVVNIFKGYGYSVGVNEPYSNSLTPSSEKNYSSIMIEVNKKVYMNETFLTLNRNSRQWMRWYGCINEVYKTILTK